MTMDLHADQSRLLHIPSTTSNATPILLGDVWIAETTTTCWSVPDVGGVVRAAPIAKRLDSDLAIIDKRRPKANVSE